MQAKLIEVIETHENRGSGSQDNPVRAVKQYWSLDGDLLMEDDTWFLKRKIEQLESSKEATE